MGVTAAWYGAQSYFRWDEWSYWTVRRDFLDAGGLKNVGHFFFAPHGGSIPAGIVSIWLPLDWLFGVRVYLPYVIPSIVMHVVAGVALFELLVARLRPAVAMGSAGLFLLMGHAASGIVYGWMVGFITALGAMFGALLAIDRARTWGNRRTFAVTTGAVVVSILFTGVGLVVVAVVAMSYMLRRRFWAAASHVAVAAALFGAWRLLYQPPSIALRWSEVSDHVAYVWRGLTLAAADLVGSPWRAGGWLLVAAAVIGVVWSWITRADQRVINASTLIGAVFFYGLTAVRAVELSPQSFSFDQDRYLYVATALLLPSIAWLTNRLLDGRRWVGALFVILILWAVPVNVGRAFDAFEDARVLGRANRVTIETAASLSGHLGGLESGFLVADRSARFTVDQFERLVAQGKVPCVADYDRAVEFARRQGMSEPTPDQITCGR